WGQPGNARQHTTTQVKAVNVYECWIHENYEEWIEQADPTLGGPRRVVIDQWRVVVYSGSVVLLDELATNLFHADTHPYSRHVDEEIGEFWGAPLLRDLAPCQQAMNTLLAMGQNNIIFTGNPIMITAKGSGVDRSTFLNRPGMVYDVNNGNGQAQQNRPDWLKPPDLPQSLLALVGLWRDEMERIAGLSSTQRGEVPSGRATDRQVQAGQEAGFVRVRSSVRNLELCLRRCGELVANLIVLNYDTPRFVAIVGDEGEQSSIRLSAQHFYAPSEDEHGKIMRAPMKFALTVNAGSAKPTSRAARIQEANALFMMHVVDDQFVLQAYQVPHWREVQARKQQQEQMELQIAQAQAAAGMKQKMESSHGRGHEAPSPVPRPA
ncbi:MAG TPA: hypothetical protein VNF73_01190, partial [Candidatus Saccharimonadales bacterium]|nr:hypothetical protein [Candidatus Saccharimonadales bacterium]